MDNIIFGQNSEIGRSMNVMIVQKVFVLPLYEIYGQALKLQLAKRFPSFPTIHLRENIEENQALDNMTNSVIITFS